MRVAIPISHKDIGLVERLVPRIIRLGSYPAHDLTLVHFPDCAVTAHRCKSLVADRFRSVEVIPFEVNVVDAWPQAANAVFTFICRHMKVVHGGKKPWYLMEPDVVPLKRGWLDALDKEYFDKGTPYVGCLSSFKVFQRATGTVDTPEDDVPYMAGTGMYPGDVISRIPLIKFCTSEPWDVVSRFMMYRQGMSHTELIQNNWRTCEYTRNRKGEITCSDVDSLSNFGISYANKVAKEAVVLHGCKDGSIYNILEEKKIKRKKTTIRKVATKKLTRKKAQK